MASNSVTPPKQESSAITATPKPSNSLNKPKASQEQIIGGFNALRAEQRQLANKIVELEADVTEHRLVIEALNEVKDDNRKCFRMIGGVLVERTVQQVLPSLEKNKEMISQVIEQLKSQVVTKGKEITDYMEKHNITIRQEPLMDSSVPTNAKSSAKDASMPSSVNSILA